MFCKKEKGNKILKITRPVFGFKPCSHLPTPKFGPLKFYIVSMVMGQKFGQNGCGTDSSQISVTPYVGVLKLYRAEFKIHSVSVRVNKALH